MNRRNFLKGVSGSLVLGGAGLALSRMALAVPVSMGPAELPAGTLEASLLEALPGKGPLIKRTFRPPNYETPVAYFNELYTPNDAFFVRYHIVNIPEVAAQTWKLRIGGEALQTPMELSLDELKRGFERVELPALCMCAGNRRGLFQPHVPGIEWGNGAMGNARWVGVRLRDVLNKAGVKKEALEVVFDGADSGIAAYKTPDFVKSLPTWKALDENTLIAFEMNGAPLPHWNGFPARLVVPGWAATYWVKQLMSIDVIAKPFEGFWMKPAYRIPIGKFPNVDRFITQETAVNTPITDMVVNSLITNIEEGQRFRAGQPVEVKGVAWDGGYGIRMVEVSLDEGQSWRPATLGQDVGRFSWRLWSYRFKPARRGRVTVMAKASNRIGQTQTAELILNPAGYHHNLIQKVTIQVG